MTKLKIILLSLPLMAIINGCKSIQICGYQKDPVGRESIIYHGCLYDGILWRGYLWESAWISGKSQTNTLYSVRIEPNYLYSLATVAFLGIWAPVEVSWQLNSDDPAGLCVEGEK